MWYKSENGDLTKPTELDMNSSKVYVFVRKDFVQIPESGEGYETIPAHWEWQETKVRKEDWDTFEKVMEHGTALDDVYAALTELADIIAGE